MHVTLVTETYFPQVNGVSRTLGELVRYLRDRGDRVQLIHPDYGEAADGDQSRTVRSLVLPFYKELFLPLPPFRSVYAAIESFRPDILHIATEATLGLGILRFARKRRLAVVSSFHTNFDQYSNHYRVGWREEQSGVTCAGFITEPGRRMCRRRRRSESWPRSGSSGWCCGSGGLTATCFGPIGRGGSTSAGRMASHLAMSSSRTSAGSPLRRMSTTWPMHSRFLQPGDPMSA